MVVFFSGFVGFGFGVAIGFIIGITKMHQAWKAVFGRFIKGELL